MDDDLDLFGGFDGGEIDEAAAMDLSSSVVERGDQDTGGASSAKKRKVGAQRDQPVEKTQPQLVSDMVTKMGAGGRTVKYCTAFPPGETSMDLDPLIEKPFCGREPAKQYKFELDGFQVILVSFKAYPPPLPPTSRVRYTHTHRFDSGASMHCKSNSNGLAIVSSLVTQFLCLLTRPLVKRRARSMPLPNHSNTASV